MGDSEKVLLLETASMFFVLALAYNTLHVFEKAIDERKISNHG